MADADAARHFEAASAKSLLRFITCGSVDDGKSTLLGRLLTDSRSLADDQLAVPGADGVPDYAGLVDGLAAEREQGITIDVAYRFFATPARKFIVADTPGHEHYTRNMVTGASTADLAVILVDARKGILPQTRRHSHLVHLLGIRRLVLAVNKMDLVAYDRARFDAVVAEYRAFSEDAGIEGFTAIPLSGRAGDNVTGPSAAMPWHAGPSLLGHLETVAVGGADADAPFRMAVQWVNRPDQDFRGYAGRVASGRIAVGERVAVLPSGRTATVERIVTYDGDLPAAEAGRSVTLVFAEAIDCSRGDLLVAATDAHGEPASALAATLIWMADEPLVPGNGYWLKTGTLTVSARVGAPDSVIAMAPGGEREVATLNLNDIGEVVVELNCPVARVTYAENRRLGGFILIDKLNNATVAAGLVRHFPPRETSWSHGASNGAIEWLAPDWAGAVDWANDRVRRLRALGRSALVLDEAMLRAGLAADLRFDKLAQAELILCAREAAKLMSLAGAHVIVAVDALEEDAVPGVWIACKPDDEWNAADWVI